MKWYRHLHAVIFIISFVPLFLAQELVYVALPLVTLIPFSVNEFVIAKRSKQRLSTSVELVGAEEKILHTYRHSDI